MLQDIMSDIEKDVPIQKTVLSDQTDLIKGINNGATFLLARHKINDIFLVSPRLRDVKWQTDCVIIFKSCYGIQK